ncbi:hypothetical protein KUTeg_002470 [Tegillarca granosa]|uniref:EamA domain-containing protein n=1 Tax=Tegillarca granosa TaxID=220873 RepID=A0ABQ9FUD6_TEGGR|nr:hypothetical protein KUTeg_002470 [Tegillarca granosa]
MLSGFMWAVATASWFITNRSLSEPVAFTILSTLPPAIGALIGTFVFKEITTKSNRIRLAIGLITALLSAILSALSKKAKQSC